MKLHRLALLLTVMTACATTPSNAKEDAVQRRMAELKLRSTAISVHSAMEIIQRLHAEETLEAWAKGEGIEEAKVIDFTARLTNTLSRTKWTEAKKRERNPEDFDRIVKQCMTGAEGLHNLVADREAFKKAANDLMQSCVDCHTLYK